MRLRSIIAAALAGLSLSAARPEAAVVVPGGFVNDTLVTGFSEPNSMAFLPDGRLLVTEQRTGRVRLVVGDHIAASDPVHTIADVRANTYERGLQGIAVDPGWPLRPYVYLYYTRVGGYCRLVRYRASGDLDAPAGESFALGDSLLLLDDIPDNHGDHNAGCLRFGPGDYLYASLGDDSFSCGAGDSTSLRGALLRLDVSGLPDGPGGEVPRALLTPASNPLTASNPNARLVWAYGMRNPWRFGVDRVTGAVYAADVGFESYEELNEILPGDFLGWPYREGPLVRPMPSCPERGGSGANAYKSPLVAVAHEDSVMQAIVSAGMYRPVPGATDNWPQNYHAFYGDVFYSDYFAGYLRRLKRLAGAWGTPPAVYGQPNAQDWATGLTSPVDFTVGPDGSLWWLSQYDSAFTFESGSVQRIRWTGLTVDVGREPAPAGGSLGAAPNPFHGTTRIALRLPGREAVSLSVYDLAGRRVRRLLEGEAPAGISEIEWDGRDATGGLAPPGLYFARLERARGRTQATRLLRLR